MQHRAKKSRAYKRMINIEGKERQRFTHIQIRGRRGDLWWRHGQEFQELIKDANLHVSQTKPVKPKPDEWKSLWTQRPKSDNAEPQRIRALKSTKDKRQISHKGKTIGLTSTLSTSAGGVRKEWDHSLLGNKIALHLECVYPKEITFKDSGWIKVSPPRYRSQRKF